MLRRLSSNAGLVILGIVLIVIALFSISFLLAQVAGNRVEPFASSDPNSINFYSQLFGIRFILQSVYLFLTGIVLLTAGLFKPARR